MIVGTVTGYADVFTRIKYFLERNSDSKMSEAALEGAKYAEQMCVREMVNTPEYIQWPHSRRPSGPPGGYPAIQNADLISSFETKVIGPGQAAWDAGGSEESAQAFFQEFGTVNAAPRPFARSTIGKYGDEIKQVMANRVRGIKWQR